MDRPATRQAHVGEAELSIVVVAHATRVVSRTTGNTNAVRLTVLGADRVKRIRSIGRPIETPRRVHLMVWSDVTTRAVVQMPVKAATVGAVMEPQPRPERITLA